MDQTLLEQLQDARKSQEVTYMNVFNNGKRTKDKYSAKEKMTKYYLEDMIRSINYSFVSTASHLAHKGDYDTVAMFLEMGLVFPKSELGENDQILVKSEPLKGMARCYTGTVVSYLDGKEAHKYSDGIYSRDGFVDYDKFVLAMKENGVSFTGPETFEEFERRILSGEKFDVALFANLKPKKEETVKVVSPVTQEVVEQPVVPETKEQPVFQTKKPVRRLAKIFCPRKK
ncbi:MAG: hypothetical protein IKO78_01945 [Bacilli bacterium]|nr:hypothetical protein [Bacilli bacterium]